MLGGQDERPVPAPRRIKFTNITEKTSSDTDRDVAEIDLNEIRVKSDTDSKSQKINSNASQSVTPVPKPRKKKLQIVNNIIDKPLQPSVTSSNNQKHSSTKDEAAGTSAEEVKIHDVVINKLEEKDDKSEIPLIDNLKHEYVLKSEKAIEEKLKKE